MLYSGITNQQKRGSNMNGYTPKCYAGQLATEAGLARRDCPPAILHITVTDHNGRKTNRGFCSDDCLNKYRANADVFSYLAAACSDFGHRTWSRDLN